MTSGLQFQKSLWTENEDIEIFSMLRAVTLNISELFYERATFNWPLIVSSKLGNVGTTSFTNVLEMRDKKDDQFLANTERTVVLLCYIPRVRFSLKERLLYTLNKL